MTTTTSRVKVKTPKSGSERLELVLLESDNSINKASIPSLPQSAMMQPHTQPTQQPTTPTQPYQSTITAPEARNDNNTTAYLPNQYNNNTNTTNNNNIDDNSSYLTGCSASTAETDNRASAYRNNGSSSMESLETSWSREYADVNDNTRGERDGREGVGESGVRRENEDGDEESDLYGSLEQCESIININDILSNTGGEGGSRSGSPVNSEPVVAKNEQPAAVVETVNTAAAVESEEETSQQSQPRPIQSSPTNLQYKKSVSFDQSLDELLTSATSATTSEEEDQSSASSSAANDMKKKKSKKSKKGKKKKGSDGSVKSEDTSVESVGYKVKTTFGSGKKKAKSTTISNPKQQQEATLSNNTNSTEEEEDTENNPSLSSQQQQQKKNSNNRRKSAPKVLRVSKYSKQKSTSSLSFASSSKVAEDSTASAGREPVDVDEIETKSSTKGKSKGKTILSTTRTTNDVESACSVVTEPLLDVLMREEQQHQHQQNVNKEDIPEVVQEQQKSATRRELRKQRSSRVAGSDEVLHEEDGDQQQYGQQQQQQPRLQHRRTLPRDHPNYQSSQRSDQYNQCRGGDDSIQRSNSNISNATSLYSAYSNVALDGYVEPSTNLTNNSRNRKKKKEKKEKKGIFRKTARVAIKSVKGGKKLGKQFIQKVKDWYDDDEEYDVDDYGASVVMTEYDYGNDEYNRRRDQENKQVGYSFEGYDHLKSPRNSPRGGSTPPSVPSPPQGNGTLTNPWTGIGGPQDQQGSQKKVSPNFTNNNPWSVGDKQQQHGEYNQDGMPQIKWWTWKQKEKRPTTADEEAAEDEASNESMEYTYFAFLSKVKAS